MPFVGRMRERRIAKDVIEASGGSGCLLIGEEGIGKTTLARAIAEEHGAVVVAASPSERMWPYSGLSALAAGLGGERRHAVDALLARGRDWPEHLIAEELSRTLHLVSGEPDIVVVDDLDHLDGASVTVLSYVFGRLRGTGLSVVATAGTADGRRDFAGMRRARIERLSFEESLDLARAVLGPTAAAAVLHTVAACAGGDPGILSRVRLTPCEAAGDDPLPFPLRLVDDDPAHRERRRRRDPRIDGVMDLLCVGPVFGHDRLRSVAAERGLEMQTLIDEGLVAVHGELARIADPARRLRQFAALSADERSRLHAQASQEHAQKYPATHLWHRSHLETDCDRTRLLVAAVDLARSGEPSAAVEFAERALAGRVDDVSRCRLLVDLGEALVMQGHDERGRHYLRRAGAPGDPEVRTRAALAWLRATRAADHVVDETMLRVATETDDPHGAERLLCESARLHLWRAETERAVGLVGLAVQKGVASTETALLARLLAAMGADVLLPGAVDSGVAAGTSRPDLPLEQELLALQGAILREEYAAVRRRIVARLESRPRAAPYWRDQLHCLQVMNEVRGGDPVAAREAVEAWRREWGPGRAPHVADVLVLAGAAALDPLGDGLDELVRLGRDLCRRAGMTTPLPWFAVIEGGAALAEGRFDDAVVSLHAAREAVPCDDPSILRADADLIEALWLSGDRAEARRTLARLEAASARIPRRWTTLAVARSRAVCRSDGDGAEAFRVAAAVSRTDDPPIERLLLTAARERCLPAADRPPARAVPRHADRGRSLTPHERDVVALVGQGLRNREIAATLFISLRTVELRLTGIYRKLGVTSRVHLVALLHGSSPS
ncbi:MULTISPECIES: LuxR C-terminal-related transcriptional regulator [Microbacterium]|uniref:LuxR C-terminal-related transcriptional regulator n=1 Tax=Microbacterium TaxID=33882 RepID=UPI0027843657|nr:MULTISPECIES: LuxR C-terminal-related transcriptional regulator [Microbacterium]MDQ1084399.1 DNA-binding CsgD family transcriptional regulator [Microbacterium sp. SORGH_AS_0344]MDQ1170327.1 DNA-binding CsgD family transcriptional regulator [Microbacterium proteolyticum]